MSMKATLGSLRLLKFPLPTKFLEEVFLCKQGSAHGVRWNLRFNEIENPHSTVASERIRKQFALRSNKLLFLADKK